MPDGVFMSASLGGDTLQEMRICMNLAEQEREGGVSPITSPFLSLTELGNVFARCKFNLPTVDVQKTDFEFTSLFSLMNFLQIVGEQNALVSKRQGLRNIDTFIAGAAIFNTLFNKKTIGQRDENSTSILIDEFV